MGERGTRRPVAGIARIGGIAALTLAVGLGAAGPGCAAAPTPVPPAATDPPAITATCAALVPVLGPAPGSVAPDEGIARTLDAYRTARATAPPELLPTLDALLRTAGSLTVGPAASGSSTTLGGADVNDALAQQQALEAWYHAFCE